jgi:hypothetical protein
VDHKRLASGVLAFIIVLLLAVPAALATEAGAQANSPGVRGQKPLHFESITLANSWENVQNANDIPTAEPQFKLQFDKNVVNSTVWAINRTCFTLVSQDNQNIPIVVTKVDDTIDFTQRQVIWVQPAVPLSPNTIYSLDVSPALKAENGVSVLGGTTGGQGMEISFKTSAQSAAQPAQSAVSAAGQMQTGNNGMSNGQPHGAASPAGGGSVANNLPKQSAGAPQGAGQGSGATGSGQSSGKAQGATAAHGLSLNSEDWLTIAFMALILGWIVAEVFVKRRKGL